MAGKDPPRRQAVERIQRRQRQGRVDRERPRAGPTMPVVTDRVVMASPTKIASSPGRW
jgi:hypothetical protein